MSQRTATLLKVLIGVLLVIGTLRMIASFYEGFSLVGLAALLYLGVAILKQLTSLNELLKYSLFKQAAPTELPRTSAEANRSQGPTVYNAQRRT